MPRSSLCFVWNAKGLTLLSSHRAEWRPRSWARSEQNSKAGTSKGNPSNKKVTNSVTGLGKGDKIAYSECRCWGKGGGYVLAHFVSAGSLCALGEELKMKTFRRFHFKATAATVKLNIEELLQNNAIYSLECVSHPHLFIAHSAAVCNSNKIFYTYMAVHVENNMYVVPSSRVVLLTVGSIVCHICGMRSDDRITEYSVSHKQHQQQREQQWRNEWRKSHHPATQLACQHVYVCMCV